MRLNKKGFTLIELLAVVVIMLAISVMAVSSISAAVERNKKKQDNAKIKVIESYAEVYYNDNKNTVSGKKCILLKDLDLTDKERTNSDGDTFSGCVSLESGNFLKYVEQCSCSD